MYKTRRECSMDVCWGFFFTQNLFCIVNIHPFCLFVAPQIEYPGKIYIHSVWGTCHNSTPFVTVPRHKNRIQRSFQKFCSVLTEPPLQLDCLLLLYHLSGIK